MPKVVMIAGAYGFLGRHCSKYFSQQGAKVVGIGHGEWGLNEWKDWGVSEWHCTDVTLEFLASCKAKPDVIVNCAGSSVVGFSLHNPYSDYKRTVETTLDILEFVRKYSPATYVVYPSSAAVYGAVKQLPINEIFPRKPVSPYGVHKKISEDLCFSYAKFFNINVSVVRLFSVYGAGLKKQLLWDACEKIQSNDTTFFGSGDEKRDWIHVDDAVRLIAMVSDSQPENISVFNGGTGVGISVHSILKEILNAFNSHKDITFNGESRGGDPISYVAGIDRAEKLGWYPTKDWKREIKAYVKWYIGLKRG